MESVTISNFFRNHILRGEYLKFSKEEREAAFHRAEDMMGADLDRRSDCMVATIGEQTIYLLMHPDAQNISPRARRYLRASMLGKSADSAECFGHCRNDSDCRECDFLASCRCIGDTEPHIEQRSGMVSAEEIDWSRQLSVAPAEVSDGDAEAEPDERDLTRLSEFCRFIFSLDDYTLGILAAVIVPGDPAAKCCSVSDLARLHDCSRQAMHRKMLAAVRQYPPLAATFSVVLKKIQKSRRYFNTNRNCTAKLTDAD